MAPIPDTIEYRPIRRYCRQSRYLLSDQKPLPRMVVPWPVDFPTELVFEVFKYLRQSDLASACLVNKFCFIL
jgi:hypothetical protein